MTLDLSTNVDPAPALAVPRPPEREQCSVVQEVAEDGRAPIEQDNAGGVDEHVEVQQVVVDEIAVLGTERQQLPYPRQASVELAVADARAREKLALLRALPRRVLADEVVRPRRVDRRPIAVPQAVAAGARDVCLPHRVHRGEE